MLNPEFALYEHFYRLEKSGRDFQEYLRHKMIATPFGDGYHNTGFVTVIEGIPPSGTLLCLKTEKDYWRGFFYSQDKITAAFDTEQSQSQEPASLPWALFTSLEKIDCVERVTYLPFSQKFPSQFSINENWKDPKEIKAHWIGEGQ